MQVILKPVTAPETGEIIINDSLFAIGRHEHPFADYDAHLVARLSRRHARIFEQDGVVYLTDLGSLNGTSVNGQNLGTLPVRLQRNDRICFTDLCYQVESLGTADAVPDTVGLPPPQLTLIPERQTAILEPIVVTRFPFLINKTSEVFSRYRDSLPAEVSYISRRHAHLFLKGQDLHIEDLGSTNGTFVNGQRLEEPARQLVNGDQIAFGGDNFVYRVQLLLPGQTSQVEAAAASDGLTATVGAGEDHTRTTFVTSANSFLDIYCIEDEPAQRDADAEDATGGNSPPGRWQRMVGTPLSLLREMRGGAGEGQSARTGRYWLAALAAIAAVGLWAYQDTAPRRALQQSLAQGDYLVALQQAESYLTDHPDDREVSALATEAWLRTVVPDWRSAVEKGDFATADRMLASGDRLAGNLAENRTLLADMQWVTQVEAYIARRGGVDSPLVLFRDEAPLRRLLTRWDTDPDAHRRSLATIARHVPAFVALRARVLSHVRTLESQRALSLTAIDRLLAAVRDQLEAGQPENLYPQLAEFEADYPGIKGIEALRTDLQNYERIVMQMRDGQWLAARRQAAADDFVTPVFRAQVQQLNQQQLPPAEVVARYDRAEADWRKGDTEAAQKALEQLSTERWGEEATRRLRHYRTVLSDYENLQGMRGQPDYALRLLAFFRRLDPDRDSWFVHALAEAFRIHSDKALTRAGQDFDQAEKAWQRYRASGGIRPLHRLEAEVSSTYRERADLLNTAYRHSAEGLKVYALLNAPLPEAQTALRDRIVSEIQLQRQSLGELSMVLEPSLKQSKLELLPVVKAEGP